MEANEFFRPWERVAATWEEALSEIRNVRRIATARRELVWRGVGDARYPLHSSLYRRLFTRMGTPPSEGDLVTYEVEMLRLARRSWRFDNLSALEILAQTQHFGGPTRLLDVTFNPFVALWFAVERKYDATGAPRAETDGRLFIFDVTDRQIDLEDEWKSYSLPWQRDTKDSWKVGLPHVWRPPAYNQRIPAQNSAFLLGGVPRVKQEQDKKYAKEPDRNGDSESWEKEEVRQATSVPLHMNSLDKPPAANKRVTFTLRIAAAAKPEIRQALEKDFGFNVGSIYPDHYGLAHYGAAEVMNLMALKEGLADKAATSRN